MASKQKSFTTPTTAFISGTQNEKPTTTDQDIAVEGFTIPAGYRLVRESKSQRIQLLVTPTTAANLKTAAAVEGISLNELCNRIFEDFLKRG